MSRYIDADAVKNIIRSGVSTDTEADQEYVCERIDEAPSIDIVRCKECRWAKANGTYQWCGRLDSTARITADDFCSYGSRSEKPNNCDACKYGEDKHRYAHFCNECGVGINNYEPKDEPQDR